MTPALNGVECRRLAQREHKYILVSLAYSPIRSSSPLAHASLTVELAAFASPGILSQPPFSMKVALSQELTSFNSLSFS